MQTKYLTIKDLQKILSIGRNTAYDLVNSGEIPSIRIGEKRLIRINPEDLEKYLHPDTKSPC